MWCDGVHLRRDTISPKCPPTENTRIDSTRPWEFFCKQADLQKMNNWNYFNGVLSVPFSNFIYGFHGFHLKKLKIIRARKKKFVVTIECFCLGTIGLIVFPWKTDVLKTNIFALKALLLGQIFVLSTSNFRGQLSADSSSTETLHCLDSVSMNKYLIDPL